MAVTYEVRVVVPRDPWQAPADTLIELKVMLSPAGSEFPIIVTFALVIGSAKTSVTALPNAEPEVDVRGACAKQLKPENVAVPVIEEVPSPLPVAL